jgi:hypothetical protein
LGKNRERQKEEKGAKKERRENLSKQPSLTAEIR